MTKLEKLLARHPIQRKPYNSIKLSSINARGTLLYRVARFPKEVGALEALRLAFQEFGAHCFHCRKWLKPQPLSQQCNRDHLFPKHAGGGNELHNLVIACGPCNRDKGGKDIIAFRTECGAEYLRAMEQHLVRCLRAIVANNKEDLAVTPPPSPSAIGPLPIASRQGGMEARAA